MPRKVFAGVDYDDGYDDYDDYDGYDYDEPDDTNDYGKSQAPEPVKEVTKLGIWSCPICTYDNEDSLTACDICGVLRNPLPRTNKIHDKKTVDALCKDPGVSRMARALFAALPRGSHEKGVLFPKQTVTGLVEASHHSRVRGPSHEFYDAFSSKFHENVNIEPFKFDVPSPDDLVSGGFQSSKAAPKAATKKSDSASVKTQRSRSSNVNNINRPNLESSSKYGSVSKQSGDVASGASGRRNRAAEASPSVEETRPQTHSPGKESPSLPSRSQASYKPENWMLPEKEASDLNQLNLAIVGHVDSGKSTLSGRLLHLLGRISQKQMHKYEKEAKQQGKGSFAYAWALDESPEERERGITMTVGVAYFDTKKYHVVVLDSPGHKDFVPNMISGATQADAAILVIDASPGAFEAGINPMKGQTREHAQLIRSFGVDQLIVGINKMDVIEYSKERYETIKQQLGTFLRGCGFKDSSLLWIPLSVRDNQNLVSAPSDARLGSWYRGPNLLDAIDSIPPPVRDVSKPVVMPICDVVRTASTGQVSVIGKLEAGALRSGSKVIAMPSGDVGTVKSLERDSRPCAVARSGDNVSVVLSGIEEANIMSGDVLCHPDFPVPTAQHFELKVVVLEGAAPILIGSQLEFHVHHAKQAAVVMRITSLLDPKTGKASKIAPRCVVAKQSAILEVSLNGAICAEEYSKCKALGRVSLRSLGRTVAVGVITGVIEDKA